ncbi:MAG: LytR/AlgR family response regulator transcription factor [Burkholderiales bacterium]|jgi:two-component system response regulator AlgR|nr:LytTR family DNA-binding domain-containing protein [Nitrosomonadaceae bacterium]
MTQARILIVDDEAPARKRLSNLLDDCREQFALTIVDEASNGVEAIDIINRGGVDIVLCDIRMPVMDGIEVARHLATLEVPPKLIFATAFDEYAVKAFELNAVDYLLKPIRQERLLAALQKARSVAPPAAKAIADATQHKRKHLSIHERGRVVLVPLEEVLYLKAEQKYLTVRTAQREYLLEESLTRMEEEFAGVFTRIHRNALVATAAIAGFERVANTSGSDDAEQSDGGSGMHWVCAIKGVPEKLPVSRRQQHVIREI